MKIRKLIKLCENDKFVYFYQKSNTSTLLFKGEKHGSIICKTKRIAFRDFMEEIIFTPKNIN